MRETKLYRHAFLVLFLCVSVSVFSPRTLTAQEGGFGEEGRIYTIQNKIYRLKHEFNLSMGSLPMDALYKGITLGAGYTHHLSDHFAWEALHGLYTVSKVDTGVKDALINIFSIEPSSFREVDYLINSNFVFTPLYGKMAWLNRKLIHLECYLTAGPGLSGYTYFEPAGNQFVEEKKHHFSMNYGIGIRVFVNKRFATRLDIRDYVNFVTGGVDHVVYIGLGVGWNFRLPKFAEMEEEE